jgi:hypothetical protein
MLGLGLCRRQAHGPAESKVFAPLFSKSGSFPFREPSNAPLQFLAALM